MPHECPRCGNLVPLREEGSGLQRRYCSQKCQQAFWREQNPERDRKSKREYREKNREKVRAKNLARYYETKETFLVKQKARYQKTRLTSPWRVILNAAKARAKATRIPFDLTTEWITLRWTGKCELTGLPFVLGLPMSAPRTFTPSIDRIIPEKGYLQENCRIVLQSINALKGTDSDENALVVARAFVENMK